MLKKGSVLQGQHTTYRIQRVVYRRGKHSVVYEAVATDTEERVIVKEWQEGYKEHLKGIRNSVAREIDTLQNIRKHPSTAGAIIKVRDRISQPLAYVMDYLPQNAYDWYKVRERGCLSSLLPINRRSDAAIKDLVIKVGAAISEVHQAGYVHVDIKPENIRINKHGDPVLCDFSSAQPKQPFDPNIIQPTREYFPPGDPSRFQKNENPEKIDIYGLAATFYELFEGTPPPKKKEEVTYSHTPEWIRPVLMSALQEKIVSINNFVNTVRNTTIPVSDKSQVSFWNRLKTHPGIDVPSAVISIVHTALVVGAYIWVVHQAPGVIALSSGIWMLLIPFVISVLSIWRMGSGALASVIFQAIVLLQVAPNYGILQLILAAGLGIGSLLSRTTWLLSLFAILPLLHTMGAIFVFPVLAWVLKPERFYKLRLPATLVLGFSLVLSIVGMGCQDLPFLCPDENILPLTFTNEPLSLADVVDDAWVLTQMSPKNLVDTFVEYALRFYPIWPLFAWGVAEFISSHIALKHRIETVVFQPYARVLVSLCILLANCFMLYIGLVIQQEFQFEESWQLFWMALEPHAFLLVVLTIFLSAYYNPSDTYGSQASKTRLIILLPIGLLVLFLTLPLWMEAIDNVLGFVNSLFEETPEAHIRDNIAHYLVRTVWN